MQWELLSRRFGGHVLATYLARTVVHVLALFDVLARHAHRLDVPDAVCSMFGYRQDVIWGQPAPQWSGGIVVVDSLSLRDAAAHAFMPAVIEEFLPLPRGKSAL